MRPASAASWALVGAAVASLVACAHVHFPSHPEDACVPACSSRAPRCGAMGCVSGCMLAADRFVEHEGEQVLTCVEKSDAACDDTLWADCAARIGVHLDGGPPSPPPAVRH